MDIADGFIAAGLAALLLGLFLTHPALVLAAVGYVALSHGLNRSR